MTPRMARVVLGLSSLLLVAVVITALTGGTGADLAGRSVRGDATATGDVAPSAGWGVDAPGPARETTTAAELPPVAADPVAAGLAVPPPTRLRIEQLGVDDPVVTVGLERDGSLQIPGPRQVGWYRGSVAPGAPSGSSVLTAHVDYDGTPGVFLQLAQLELGAEIVTADAGGVERRYQVTERYQVGKDELDADELFRREGPPTLTLITCGGSFDERARHYQDNIVIRATPV